MKRAMKQELLVFLLSLAALLMLIGVTVFFFLTAQLSKQVDQANQDRFDLTYNANRFMNGSSYLTNEVRGYAATGMQEHYDNYWNEINTLKNRDAGVENMKQIGLTVEEQAQIDAMSALSNQLVPLEENAMNDVAAGNLSSALNYVYGEEYSASIAKINEIKTGFLTMLDERTQAQINQLSSTSEMLQVLTTIFVVLAVAMQIISLSMTRGRVIKPIAKIQRQMEEISRGNLSAPFDLKPDTSEIGLLVNAMLITRGELKKYIGDITGQLSNMAEGNMNIRSDISYVGEFLPIQQSLATILDFLNQTLQQINEAAAQVASGSEQVSDGAQSLSQGATEQASAVEELAATINEISSQVVANADHAAQANSKAQHTGDELLESNRQMQEMIAAMETISNSSSQIGKIIKTIEDIAFQTNILALNAAVEAARAGSAGKGFAVVADEVRSLATKSQEASKSTSGLIAGSLEAVENGRKIADRTAKSLVSAVNGARDVTETIAHITQASAAQADSISQVTQGIDQISAVVQTNSATAEESAAASQELSGQAARLKQLVGQFQLRSSGAETSWHEAPAYNAKAASRWESYTDSDKY